MIKIVDERYSNNWNIYGAQASDGDNWADDSPHCHKLLLEKILPKARFFSYIEITQRSHQTLWQHYQQVADVQPHFAMRHIKTVDDIYPVFRDLFQKNTERAA